MLPELRSRVLVGWFLHYGLCFEVLRRRCKLRATQAWGTPLETRLKTPYYGMKVVAL